MKKVLFGVGCMVTGVMLSILALLMADITAMTVFPDILIVIGFLLLICGGVLGVKGLFEKS